MREFAHLFDCVNNKEKIMKRFLSFLLSEDPVHKVAAYKIVSYLGPYCSDKFRALNETIESMKTKNRTIEEIRICNELLHLLCVKSSIYANMIFERIEFLLDDPAYHPTSIAKIIEVLSSVGAGHYITAYNVLLNLIDEKSHNGSDMFTSSLKSAEKLVQKDAN